MAVGHDTIVVRATTDGRHALTQQGFLRLPAVIRHRCHIHTGDCLLVAAYPRENLILICTLAVLDELFSSIIGATS